MQPNTGPTSEPVLCRSLSPPVYKSISSTDLFSIKEPKKSAKFYDVSCYSFHVSSTFLPRFFRFFHVSSLFLPRFFRFFHVFNFDRPIILFCFILSKKTPTRKRLWESEYCRRKLCRANRRRTLPGVDHTLPSMNYIQPIHDPFLSVNEIHSNTKMESFFVQIRDFSESFNQNWFFLQVRNGTGQLSRKSINIVQFIEFQLIDWLIDWTMCNLSTFRSNDWLIDCLIDWLIDWLTIDW